jgi:hypothetical protein
LQLRAKILAKFAQGSGGRHHNKMLKFAMLFRALKMGHKPCQKLLLALFMRVNPGLDCMQRGTHRLVNSRLAIRHQLVCWEVGIVEITVGKLLHPP